MTRLTLADLEIERKEGFSLEIGENVYEFSDPKGIQANALISLESLTAVQQLSAVLGDKAAEFLAEPEVDGYVLEAVLGRYMAHYGLGSPPEGKSSPRSSNGSAGKSKPTSRLRGSR